MERSIIVAGVTVLARQGIDLIGRASKDHVGGIENPIRTGKERENAMRLGIRYMLPALVFRWLVVHVAHMLNHVVHRGMANTPWTVLSGRRLRWEHLMRANFGDIATAWRVGISLRDNQANGEVGILLGVHARTDGVFPIT